MSLRHPILTIARLSFREVVRRRILPMAALLTAAAIGLTGWGFDRLAAHAGDQGSSDMDVAMLVLVVAYGFSMIGALGAAFLAAPAIAGEIESGILLGLLPRPIRRSDVVLGRWLGLAGMLAIYIGGAGAVELAVIRWATGYLPPQPLPAIAYLIGETIVLMTLALLCSTRLAPMAGGITAAALYGIVWIAGAAATVGASFGNAALIRLGRVTGFLLPTDGLWRGAAFSLEPESIREMLQMMGRAAPFTAAEPPAPGYLAWVGAWIAGILAVAVLSFQRRDL